MYNFFKNPLDKTLFLCYTCKAVYLRASKTLYKEEGGDTVKAKEMRRMALLLDFYGGLLTERQREICEYYYNEDLSHTEIAANTGITRQGVRDGLHKAETILLEAEESLGFVAAWLNRCEIVEQLEKRLSELGVDDSTVSEKLEALRS